MIASASQMAIKGSKAVQTLAEQNPSLFNTAKHFLERFSDYIDRAFKGIDTTRYEAKAMMDSSGQMLENVQRLWDNSLLAALEGKGWQVDRPSQGEVETRTNQTKPRQTIELPGIQTETQTDTRTETQVEARQAEPEQVTRQTQTEPRAEAEAKFEFRQSADNEQNEVARIVQDIFSKEDFNYNALVQKPDMRLTQVKGADVYDGYTRQQIKALALENVRNNGGVSQTNGMAYVYVDDVDSDVHVSKRSVTHSNDRRYKNSKNILPYIGEILKNSIAINEFNPKEQKIGSYVLLGAAIEPNGNLDVVSFIVNRESGELESFDVLGSVNVKGPAAHYRHSFNTITDPTITIRDLLGNVKDFFGNVLSDDVMNTFGMERPTPDAFKDSRKYDLRGGDIQSKREVLIDMLDNQDLSVADRNKLHVKRKQSQGLKRRRSLSLDKALIMNKTK